MTTIWVEFLLRHRVPQTSQNELSAQDRGGELDLWRKQLAQRRHSVMPLRLHHSVLGRGQTATGGPHSASGCAAKIVPPDAGGRSIFESVSATATDATTVPAFWNMMHAWPNYHGSGRAKALTSPCVVTAFSVARCSISCAASGPGSPNDRGVETESSSIDWYLRDHGTAVVRALSGSLSDQCAATGSRFPTLCDRDWARCVVGRPLYGLEEHRGAQMVGKDNKRSRR